MTARPRNTSKDLGTFGIFFDETYADTPLDTAYNQVHIPGATGRGTNVVATEDAVYLVDQTTCHVLDVPTGETRLQIPLPDSVGPENRQWGFLGVYQNVLLGGAGFANYSQRPQLSSDDGGGEGTAGEVRNAQTRSLDTSASNFLVAFDRHSGKILWQIKAQHSFVHNGIVAGDGRLFCLDKLPAPAEERLKRRGTDTPATYRIVALDVLTGQPLWEQKEKIFGTWLSYSEEHQLLFHAGSAAADRLASEVGKGMAVYRGATGELVWRDEHRAYTGPCILYHDTILTNVNSYQTSAGTYSLLDGSPKLIVNPVTKELQPLQLSRTYGCNTMIASENFLTFRSGAAGFFDLKTFSGTGNLGGFKSGCTANLIVANGVLNAPDYTRTCSCGYQNQTSLALVHMPELDMWTLNYTADSVNPVSESNSLASIWVLPVTACIRMAPCGSTILQSAGSRWISTSRPTKKLATFTTHRFVTTVTQHPGWELPGRST